MIGKTLLTKASQLIVATSVLGVVACSQNSDTADLQKPFGEQDIANFKNPSKYYYPETWFHFIGGNVSEEGLKADLQAIADAKISGVQFFHGKFGGKWPNTGEEIQCLSPKWEGFVKFAAEEAKRLGLKFSMQNCPGWSMSGGPWITPQNAMRDLIHTRTDISGAFNGKLPLPPDMADWRDYKDVAVIAFPTPEGDTNSHIKPLSVKGSNGVNWKSFVMEGKNVHLRPTKDGKPHWFEVEIPEGSIIRTIEIPSTGAFNHAWTYDPHIAYKFEAITADGKTHLLAKRDAKPTNWQDNWPRGSLTASFACSEIKGIKKVRVEIDNKYEFSAHFIRFTTAARKNSWESEAGWVLRGIDRDGDNVKQSKSTYVQGDKILDISSKMSADGTLKWTPPSAEKWTVLRIGHINKGEKNGPAPAEATGWECDKLSTKALDIHFDNYIGRLAKGSLKGGLLKKMVLDSWECRAQTWTYNMEAEFEKSAGYGLRKFMPAIFGYVIDCPEKTGRFLLDWRTNIGDMFAKNYFGRMAERAKENNLEVVFETAAGDVFPADILEYFKYTDTPMCEFWQPLGPSHVGSLNFKPIKPTASASRLYGKKRVACESFTCMRHTWDEHWQMLREVANVNLSEGVTHLVLHTYTHNPQVNFLKPGTSFGHHIGTGFLRGQTWWHLMPEFTTYYARNSYMLERGKSQSDILWYLGDEIRHKPNQNYPFPKGFKYDYCNRDILLNRISVKDGRLTTPEGLTYSALWLDDCKRLRVETLEKILKLVQDGAVVIGEAPKGIATLKGGKQAEEKFNALVKQIWAKSGENKIGKGRVISGMSIDEAIAKNFKPQIKGEKLPLWLHRKADGADIYFVASLQGEAFKADVSFMATGEAEIWDATTGEIKPIISKTNGQYKTVSLNLAQAESCFVVFRKDAKKAVEQKPLQTIAELSKGWSVSFPEGWGAPKSLALEKLVPWKDMDMSAEGKAFSGTAVYSTTFDMSNIDAKANYVLDLGKVSMAAKVFLNGKQLGVLWCEPFSVKLNGALKEGKNELKIEITSTWFNRLVFDGNLPEAQRKTWTIAPPAKTEKLRDSGLLGPVVIKR